MPLLGHLALWVALLAGVWGAATGFAAGPMHRTDLAESARRAGVALGVALGTAVVALLVAILRQNFNVAYVASYTDLALPAPYRWAALYAGPEGRLLCWTAGVALLAAAAQRRDRSAFVATTATIVTIAVGVLLVAENPFVRLPYTPVDGRGLAAELQDAGMLISPPVLYLGSAAAVLAVGFAVASLRAGRLEPTARSWILIAWILGTLGIAAGLWWAYRRLGWEGSWVWDPVRNQSLPAWLALSALIQTMPTREAQGRFGMLHATLMFGAGGLSVWGMFAHGSFEVEIGVSLVMLFVLVGVMAVVRPLPRGWGARAAQAGVVLVGLVLAAQTFRVRAEQTLRPGESTTLRAWGGRPFTFSYLAASRYPVQNRVVTRALVEVRRGSRLIGRVGPEQLQFVDVFGNDSFESVSRAAVLHRGCEDVYAALVTVSGDDDRAVLRFAVNPFVPWTWVGMLLAAAGGLVALGTSRARS